MIHYMKRQINKSHMEISMQHSFYAQEAALLWHERIGRHLGQYEPMLSAGGAYPILNKYGVVKLNRIGAGTASAILIDANGANLVERIHAPSIEKFNESGVCLIRYTKDYSLIRGVMDWVLDARRAFPMLIGLPTKAHIVHSLRLSHVDEEVCICSPKGTKAFNARKVRAARDFLVDNDIKGVKWQNASDLRLLVSSGDYSKNPLTANKTLDAYAKSLQTLPLSVWLPIRNTPDFEALSNAMISTKQGLQIDPIA